MNKEINRILKTNIKDIEPRFRPLYKYMKYICSGGKPRND
jgi:hypothetical protein